jgi:hypothetical protein
MPKASIQSITEPVSAPGFAGRYAELLDHTPVLHPGTELVEFSPTATLNETMKVVTQNMANMPPPPNTPSTP